MIVLCKKKKKSSLGKTSSFSPFSRPFKANDHALSICDVEKLSHILIKSLQDSSFV